jgi:hypothetical protein
MHHSARDLVLLQHDGDGCCRIDARTAFASALSVDREGLLELIGQPR